MVSVFVILLNEDQCISPFPMVVCNGLFSMRSGCVIAAANKALATLLLSSVHSVFVINTYLWSRIPSISLCSC